jgi:hypothetical protein
MFGGRPVLTVQICQFISRGAGFTQWGRSREGQGGGEGGGIKGFKKCETKKRIERKLEKRKQQK